MNLFAQLQRDEELRLFPYLDTKGKLTIGYGRNLTANGITEGEAKIFLIRDRAMNPDFEGLPLKLFAYIDPRWSAKILIGYGRNLTDFGISSQEAETLLTNDIAKISDITFSRLPWFVNLDPVRQGALLNMGFNLGFHRLEEFEKLLAAAAKGNWTEAAAEMKNSLWANQVGDRSTRLENQMLTGEWT